MDGINKVIKILGLTTIILFCSSSIVVAVSYEKLFGISTECPKIETIEKSDLDSKDILKNQKLAVRLLLSQEYLSEEKKKKVEAILELAKKCKNEETFEKSLIESGLDEISIEGVPFHYQETTWWCVLASAEMLMDYYGEDIPQDEIYDVYPDSLVFPGQGVNVFGLATVAPEFGYLALIYFDPRDIPDRSTPDWMQPPESWPDPREYMPDPFDFLGIGWFNILLMILGNPIGITIVEDGGTVGHAEVVTGVNFTANQVRVHDPWDWQRWGPGWTADYGVLGGPDQIWDKDMFRTKWENGGQITFVFAKLPFSSNTTKLT